MIITSYSIFRWGRTDSCSPLLTTTLVGICDINHFKINGIAILRTQWRMCDFLAAWNYDNDKDNKIKYKFNKKVHLMFQINLNIL